MSQTPPPEDNSISWEDLIDRLGSCPKGIFDKVVGYLNPPTGALSSEMTSQATRAVELVGWARHHDGPGLIKVQEAYDRAMYRKQVEEFALKNQGRIFLSNRIVLNRSRIQQGLEIEKAKEIEKEVLSTFQSPPFGPILKRSIIITLLLMIIRYLGFLQFLELPTYDLMMRLRLKKDERDEHVTIIAITDDFLQGKEKISNQKLLEVLIAVEKQKPVAIGLDVYRDPSESFEGSPVDYTKLVEYLAKSESVVATCLASKDIGAPGYRPPQTQSIKVPEKNLGFTNVLEDRDGKIRRQLLTIDYTDYEGYKNIPCQTQYSLSFELASRYLKAKGTNLQVDDKGIRVGEIIFKEITKFPQFHPFGYKHGEEIYQFQMMINYRNPNYQVEQKDGIRSGLFNTLFLKKGSTEQDLNSEKDKIHDRIVLIGYTSLNKQTNPDIHPTPYVNESGVVIQAHMVSQLVNAVLEERPLIGVWPLPLEIIWVWMWSLVGGGLAWLNKSLLKISTKGILIFIPLPIFSYFLLLSGWWVPFIPSALGLFLTVWLGNRSLSKQFITQVQETNPKALS